MHVLTLSCVEGAHPTPLTPPQLRHASVSPSHNSSTTSCLLPRAQALPLPHWDEQGIFVHCSPIECAISCVLEVFSYCKGLAFLENLVSMLASLALWWLEKICFLFSS